MSTLMLEPAVSVDAAPAQREGARGQGVTLEAAVCGAWESLLAAAPAACLVCGGELRARHSAGAGVVGGRCDGCGFTLG